MRKKHWLALATLTGCITLGLGAARSQLPPAAPQALQKEVALAAGVDEVNVVKVLNVLGPEVARQLAAGKEVQLPRFGTFRVVRLAEQRNLEDGRPVIQPARNVAIFIADPALNQAANAPGAVPSAEVPAFQYVPLPNQSPAPKAPGTRTPNTRTR